MADGFEFDRGAGCIGADWSAVLAKWIGTTVTIFTSSGGESGSGFTCFDVCKSDICKASYKNWPTSRMLDR
jgi:hypothetical protein